MKPWQNGSSTTHNRRIVMVNALSVLAGSAVVAEIRVLGQSWGRLERMAPFPSRKRSPTARFLDRPMHRNDTTGHSSKGASKRGSRDRSPGAKSEPREPDLESAPNLADMLRYQEQQQPDRSISSLMGSLAMSPGPAVASGDVARSSASPGQAMPRERAVASPATMLDNPSLFPRARPMPLRTRAVLGAKLRDTRARAPRERAPPNPKSEWVDWRDANDKHAVPRAHLPRLSPASSLDSSQALACGSISCDEDSTIADRRFTVHVAPETSTRRADPDDRQGTSLPTGTSLVFHPTLGRLRRLPMPIDPRLESRMCAVVPGESRPVRMVKN